MYSSNASCAVSTVALTGITPVLQSKAVRAVLGDVLAGRRVDFNFRAEARIDEVGVDGLDGAHDVLLDIEDARCRRRSRRRPLTAQTPRQKYWRASRLTQPDDFGDCTVDGLGSLGCSIRPAARGLPGDSASTRIRLRGRGLRR